MYNPPRTPSAKRRANQDDGEDEAFVDNKVF